MEWCKDCIDFAMQNYPLFSNSKIVLEEKQLQTLKVYIVNCWTCKHADHGRSLFFPKIKPKNSRDQWRFTSDGQSLPSENCLSLSVSLSLFLWEKIELAQVILWRGFIYLSFIFILYIYDNRSLDRAAEHYGRFTPIFAWWLCSSSESEFPLYASAIVWACYACYNSNLVRQV